MSEYGPDEYERASGGMDYDEDVNPGGRDPIADWQRRLQEEGPLALLEDVEQMLPEPVRTGVINYPLTAVALGISVGVFLGMKKSEPVLSALSSAVGANAAKGLGSLFDR